ncbi:MAG TPA: glutamine synthetase beta-grasp domain-containing protein [Solirubrobacteraceae bacterium]
MPEGARWTDDDLATSARDVIERAQVDQVRVIDLKFTDVPGAWQHVSLPAHALDEAAFAYGIGFDGSSIRGFTGIDRSDMLLIPDPRTAVLDPFHEQRTLSLICDVLDPITREPFERDPRLVARNAERHLLASGIADAFYVGPEAEFYIFDEVSFEQDGHTASYRVDSVEARWSGSPRQQGYFLVPPADIHGDLRARMTATLEEMGILREFHQHEVAPACTCTNRSSTPAAT